MGRRLSDEQGASAVLVAIVIVVLFGMGAIVLDVGNLMWERRMLQNSADAAALSAAQDVVAGQDVTAADVIDDVRDIATANSPRGAHVAEEPDGIYVDQVAQEVRVVAQTGSTTQPGTLTTWLAGVLGDSAEETSAAARAVAGWSNPSGGEGFPLAISACEWKRFLDIDDFDFDDASELDFSQEAVPIFKSDSSEVDECKGPAGQNAPGGFGKLETDDGCVAVVDDEGWVSGDTGGDPPDCDADDFNSLLGQEVLVPIFDDDNDLTGNNHEYRIAGFAGFELEGYQFPGNAWNEDPGDLCSANENCIIGRFVRYVALGEGVSSGDGGLDFGANVINLRE